MYIIIPRATTKNITERDILVKNPIGKLKWNTKKYTNNPKDSKKGKTEKKQKER